MKICGIISEYNPFHSGHKYHIEETRRRFGATHIVSVMSGNFTQRGDLAITDKWKRAEMALNGGADLVIELPVAFALGSAEQFAGGAVSLINSLGCVEMLSFGSECGKIELLKETAGAVHFALESDEFLGAMRGGNAYPVALRKAIEHYYTDDVIECLASPNNTLAVEYLKAINESGSFIEPITIGRSGAAHDSSAASGNIASASHIRNLILCGKDISQYVPYECKDYFADYADIMRLETSMLAKIRTMTTAEIEKAPNVLQGLENRIHKASRAAATLPELLFLIKTKRYTMARIRRIILCCFLGITKSDLKNSPPYARILGMNERGREILAKASGEIPIDTSLAALMKKSPAAYAAGALEERCDNVYALAFNKRLPCGLDFTHKPIIL